MILLPFRFIYQMSSWTRAIVMPLSIVHASNPRRPVPAGFTLEELYLPGAPMPFRNGILGLFSWRNCFLTLDRFLKVWERVGPRFVRRAAVTKCAEWMIERFERSDGLGAIYPVHAVCHHGLGRTRLWTGSPASTSRPKGSSTI